VQHGLIIVSMIRNRVREIHTSTMSKRCRLSGDGGFMVAMAARRLLIASAVSQRSSAADWVGLMGVVSGEASSKTPSVAWRDVWVSRVCSSLLGMETSGVLSGKWTLVKFLEMCLARVLPLVAMDARFGSTGFVGS
jgi:hypothetical protein